MRIYEKYAKEPSDQLQLFGEGEVDLQAAEEWIAAHPKAWAYIIGLAKSDAFRTSAKLSMRDYVSMMRRSENVSCANALTPAFSRIAERDFPMLRGRFTKSRAKVDGFIA